MSKRLYRSRDSIVGGVCAGIAEYFGIDPTLVRIAWAFMFFAYGSGFLLYLICWILMPQAPYGRMS